MTAERAAVSSPDEPLILVDDDDREIGFLPKAACHRGEGTLHRAFSVFLFNRRGELLLQQRGADKPLWPGYWSNSCCSHPRRGESVEDAARRRIREELGVDAELRFLYKFKYHAPYGDAGSEREFCWVFAGYNDADISAHPDEIADWRYVAPDTLTRAMAERPDDYTPWLKLEWAEIRRAYLDDILRNLPGTG